MSDRVLNTELLNRIIDWLDAGAPHDEHGFEFNMGGSVVHDPHDTVCGTSCCIAGAAVAFSDPQRFSEIVNTLRHSAEAEAYWYDVGPQASALLGISGEHAERLFFMEHLTPREVAQALRDYRDSGVLPNRHPHFKHKFGAEMYEQ